MVKATDVDVFSLGILSGSRFSSSNSILNQFQFLSMPWVPESMHARFAQGNFCPLGSCKRATLCTINYAPLKLDFEAYASLTRYKILGQVISTEEIGLKILVFRCTVG